jgi:phospholipid/cholesterol/gamma-HCH transport system ATP-binding protein
MISLKSVWKGFGDQSILEGISLDVPTGEKLCVIGQSGIGKSVLLKLMVGLLRPDAGEVWVDGQEVTHYRSRDWNLLLHDFGVVFQGAALFDSLSVWENVGIRMIEDRKFPQAQIMEHVAASLEAVGLHPAEVLKKYPAELSGGMQKRVGIARAIVNRPRYLFFDEPTTGLDPVNSTRIDELINSLAQEPGRTSIIITHDMYTVKTIATQVAMIHEGKLHFHGKPQAFFASGDAEVRKFLERIQ